MDASDWIAIGNVVVSGILVFITITISNKTKSLETKMQLANQVKFSIKKEQINALKDCYLKYFSWLQKLTAFSPILYLEKFIDEQDSVILTQSEFHKSFFTLELWFFENKELVLSIEKLYNETSKMQDWILGYNLEPSNEILSIPDESSDKKIFLDEYEIKSKKFRNQRIELYKQHNPILKLFKNSMSTLIKEMINNQDSPSN